MQAKPFEPKQLSENVTQNTSFVDIILVLGIDDPGESTNMEFSKIFREACESRKLRYHISQDTSPETMALLPKTQHLIVYAHGHSKFDNHTISLTNKFKPSSLYLIKCLQDLTGANNILVCSCYIGKIIEDIKKEEGIHDEKQNILREGTKIVVNAAADEVAHAGYCAAAILGIVNKMTPFQSVCFIKIFESVSLTIPETLIFAYQAPKAQGIKSLALYKKDFINFPDTRQLLLQKSQKISEFIGGKEMLREPSVTTRKCH